MTDKKTNEAPSAKDVFQIRTTPAQDAQEARDALEKDRINTTEGVKEDMPSETADSTNTKGTTQSLEIPQLTQQTIKKHGQLLVAGRRPIKGLNSLTTIIDKDVDELLKTVIHPSSNKGMAVNELLRIALTEIHRKGELVIPPMDSDVQK